MQCYKYLMLRFTIRDVLWLMVVVGLALGWLTEHVRIGHSPGQLSTLIDVLADRNIHVGLQPHRIQVQSSSQDGSWYYDRGIGEPIPRSTP
jgi:hypothetical protein